VSPSQVPQGQAPEEEYDWVHIDDFSPGCYDGSHISAVDPIVSAPLGAAQLTNTSCCASIPGGALGPLPMAVGSIEFSVLTGGLPGSATSAVITGVIITPQLDDGDYEVVYIFEADDGTDHYVTALSYVPGVGSPNLITGPTNMSGTTHGAIFGAPYPAFTRMTTSGSGNPPPVLAFPGAVSTDASGASGHLWIYPELLSPTSYTAQDLIVSGSSITGQLIAYANRLLVLAGIDYDWPSGGGINTNENINYTNPPQSSDYGEQMTLLSIESPWGYGTWGSVSVGELLLVKKYGGAVLLYGDIDAPTSVIRVPGVQSTGDFVGSACATPIGLIYCSQNQGAWVWNGSNTAEKISENIRDDFFDLETGNIESNNYGFFVYQWQKWVLFSNNVIYDTETNAWWNLFPYTGVEFEGLPVGQNLFWYCLTQNGNQLLAAPLIVNSNSDNGYLVFDNTVPSPSYQWVSLPIHVTKDADRVIDVRQIIVRASDPTGTGNAYIYVAIGDSWTDQSNPTNTPIGNDPTPLRFNVGAGAQGLDDIIVTIFASNEGEGNPSAPIVHSIDIGYQTRARVAVAN
jgi:hypothetical protein